MQDILTSNLQVQTIHPDEFEAHNHWYQKALNATIHPMVKFFMQMGQERVIKRYCHLNPSVNDTKLKELLNYTCKHFVWSGADLLNVTSLGGKRQMVLIENNSCPSGQKSMPFNLDYGDTTGYHLLVEQTFKYSLKNLCNEIKGGFAVLYDKNLMEASGYAHAIADILKEPVYLVPYYDGLENKHVKFEEGIMHIYGDSNTWIPIRACFRYLTQKPWNRVPLHTKTKIVNPIIACLAGGRNKLVAAKAYDIFNAELEEFGLNITVPETIWEVKKNEVPLWIQKMGGQAVIKVPYSNAGQGVYTIVSQKDLNNFMAEAFPYDLFIVQSLIGNANWSSTTQKGKFHHVGTIPNKKNQTFVADIRMMISSTQEGIKPICTYARKAKLPLVPQIEEGMESWDMLGTNLSFKEGNEWKSDTNRLILMDVKDFNQLGIGLDDLIEAYIQSVLSMIAIDKMASNLVSKTGKFRFNLFESLNNDTVLMEEILKGNTTAESNGNRY